MSFQAPRGSTVSDPKSGLGSGFNWIGGYIVVDVLSFDSWRLLL
jgi:hypothetical protein